MVEICETAGPAAAPLKTDLQRQLRTSPYWPIRQLVCEIDRDRIVIRGTVPCYYLKQVAQSVALKAVGPDRLRSDIEVQLQ